MNSIIKIALSLSAFFFGSKAIAQDYQFKKIDSVKNQGLMVRTNTPTVYQLYKTEFQSVNDYLLQAPDEFQVENTSFTFNLPDADGTIVPYVLYKTSVMEEELAAEFPGLYSYIGYNQKDPSNVIRMSVSYIHGIHLMGYNGKGETYYMDAYTEDKNVQILYKRSDITNEHTHFQCHLHTENELEETHAHSDEPIALNHDGIFRQYRLAIATTGEYSQFHLTNAPVGTPMATLGQQRAVVMSAIIAAVTRLNQVYERDMALRYILVNNNQNLIYFNANNDPFENDDAYILLNQSHSVINSNIGSSNYDIGHTFSTGAGGLAQIVALCNPQAKGMGVTGSDSPVNDPFVIDYVAHEIGHQMGANHTFSGNTGSCSMNANSSTAAEPGSGSTIMGYAGICGANQNVQNQSDAYFHYLSIQEMTDRVQATTCATYLQTNNATPSVTAGTTVSIPARTPFKLTATASDNNNPNSLTYTWEQLDTKVGIYGTPTGNDTTEPNFRSLVPTSNPMRYFPALSTVINGTTNVDVAPGTTWERLSNVPRSMRFGVTVRDNNVIGGGQTRRVQRTVNVVGTQPFVLTYPSTIVNTPVEQWLIGTNKTITWNVANTNVSPINTANVKISYTTDNGQTLTELVASTPNNGSAVVQVPDIPHNTEIRIVIEPIGNVYYTISQKVRVVNVLSNKDFQFENFQLYPNPSNDVITFSLIPDNGNEIVYQIYDITGREILSKTIDNTGKIEETFSVAHLATGTYLLKISNGNKSLTKKIVRN